MINIIKSDTRGKANHGWLQSRHTFSFANYYNLARMGFSHLRVINDDTVQSGRGFDTHSHQNMEIISYVLEGEIEHQDSQGNKRRLPAGEFQLISAGSGIRHSEYNASNNNSLNFLQIWIEPDVRNGQPSYQQRNFGKKWGLTKVISKNGDDGSLLIKQDATLSQLFMQPNQQQRLTIERGHSVYVHVIKGVIKIDDQLCQPGDGVEINNQLKINMASAGENTVQALIFDFG